MGHHHSGSRGVRPSAEFRYLPTKWGRRSSFSSWAWLPVQRLGHHMAGPCETTSQLFTKCGDLIKEPRRICAGYLSSPYAESEYMDCMRDTMDYSNICDRCVCTMTGRSDWHMCAVS